MPGEVIDTNVLLVASAHHSVSIETPVMDRNVVRRVFEWIKSFREDRNRKLVLDLRQTIQEEYYRNLPKESYGRRMVIEKFNTTSVEIVQLTYWRNGAEQVAHLPDPKLDANFHDLGDRKLVAAAHQADAPIVNATDGDWTEPRVEAGLRELGIQVVQLLSEQERRALKQRP